VRNEKDKDMQTTKKLYCALCLGSIIGGSIPSLAYGHDHGSYGKHSAATHRATFAHDLASNEFFTQAERDLVARVRDHLIADPVIAPLAPQLTLMAEGGAVTVRGMLPTTADRERTIAIVERVVGVERVDAEIGATQATTRPAVEQPAASAYRQSMSERSESYSQNVVVAAGERSATSFPATGSRGVAAAQEPALPGSGDMNEEDRTGSSAPSGSSSVTPLSTGAVDTMGRVAKPAGDYAVTEVDRALVAQVRMAVQGHPQWPVSGEELHLVVDNGIVTLQGWVPNEEVRTAIGQHVATLGGVQGVNNQLRVRAGSTRLGVR
jgi:osmotically-inducible protein OsmY